MADPLARTEAADVAVADLPAAAEAPPGILDVRVGRELPPSRGHADVRAIPNPPIHIVGQQFVLEELRGNDGSRERGEPVEIRTARAKCGSPE